MMKRLSAKAIAAILESHRFRVDTKNTPSDFWRLGITGKNIGQTEEMARATARCARGCGLVVRIMEIKRQKFATIEVEVTSNCPGDALTHPFSYEDL
jgi:hypothetical protein